MSNSSRICRRTFLKNTALMSVGAMTLPALNAIGKTHRFSSPGTGLHLAVARNSSPAKNTEAAIKALGGMQRFVKPGNLVVLKPNCISARAPEFAVNTHPEVVGAITRMCMEAGASEVIAVSNDVASNFQTSGMEDALYQAGGTWEALRLPGEFREVLLPRGILLRRTQILNRVMDADVFINLPIAKDHGGSRLTLGMKNYMGINYDRQIMHARGLHQCIADLATAVKPHLTVMDANYMLLNNGPGGPGSTRNQRTVIAGTDPVLVDAFTTTLFKLEPQQIGHIQYAAEMGLGSLNLNTANIEVFNLQ